MKIAICILAFNCGVMAIAQAPAATSHTYSHPLGFSYSVPADWEVLEPNANMADAKQKATATAESEQEKKGIGCTEAPLTARHQGSVIVEVLLPYDCYGTVLTDSELASFGDGVAGGLKTNFTITAPVTGTYALGSHHLWIEHAKGTPKSDPSTQYTIEISCTLLKKAAVCWMALAADDTSLAVFEHGAVTLEGDGPAALVPADVFVGKQ